MNPRRKKGVYYSTDALLAGLLLVGVAATLLSVSYYEPNVEEKTFITQDLLNILGTLRVSTINHSFVLNEIATGNITDENNTVLEQIGEYWALNQTAKATELFEIVTNGSLPPSLNIRFGIGDDELFLQNNSEITNLVVSRRMISGIAKGAPITGSSSSAYLKKVRNKKNNAFAYFGGFYGQGNVTVTLSLPADFQSSRLLLAELKLQTPGTFNVYINGNNCNGPYTGNGTYVDVWDISACNTSFQAENNSIDFVFTSDLGSSYIAGGFLKVTYTTDTVKQPEQSGFKRYHLPDIEGFINLYDAFAAQGVINNWTLNMTFYNEYDTFVTIGNETIFVAPGDNQTQNVVYSRYNQSLPPTAIPLRIGTTNLSNITIVKEGLPADSFLVTDVSGSMTDCGEYGTTEYCNYWYKGDWWWWWWSSARCLDTGSCTGDACSVGASSTTGHYIDYNCLASLMDLAKEADHLFVDIIFNDSLLHSIGLVDYSSNANPATDLTNVNGTLHNEIDTYSAGGGTCTCCGINRARTLLNTSPNNKFMIVLSDGEPTLHCDGSITETSGTSGSAQGRTDAIASGQAACDQNITVYTIGFGESMSVQGHDVMRQIACNDSLYFNATNVTQLAQIYENISNQVLVAANYSSQTINVIGNFSTAELYDSFIDLYYEPVLPPDLQGRLSLTFESDQFSSCDETIALPEGVIIEDAFVTSFSGMHWTKDLEVNGATIFNLSAYDDDFALLGDPFIVQIPSVLLTPGANNDISLSVGDSPANVTSCSENNSLIYTVLINASTPRSQAMEVNEGCNWTVQSETDKFFTLYIPSTYTGANTCSYTNSSINYNALDAYDSAVYHLLRQLDPDDNGKVLVDLTEADLEITITLVSGIPYLWGPTIAHAQVWT